jgi:hypothetical protein
MAELPLKHQRPYKSRALLPLFFNRALPGAKILAWSKISPFPQGSKQSQVFYLQVVNDITLPKLMTAKNRHRVIQTRP